MSDRREDDDVPAGRMRLDVFLFRIRQFKTRSGASEAIGKRGARISRIGQTRRVDKPATLVEAGDMISFSRGDRVATLTIASLPARRGPASEAAACYVWLDDGNDEQA